MSSDLSKTPHTRPEERFRTLVDVLRFRAEHQGDDQAALFLLDGERPAPPLTYADLDRRARALAAHLREQGLEGERALLLYPPGLEFLTGLFGCFYAGVLGVPVQIPLGSRKLTRVEAIAADCRPALALTEAASERNLRRWCSGSEALEPLQVIASDGVAAEGAEAWREPKPDGEHLAYLQYTSGSTSLPKGVMVSHGNLIANLTGFDFAPEPGFGTRMVTWLPSFHDMGLIYGLLGPIFRGFPCVAMAPAAFLQKPLRWLRAISEYRGTHSASPNFGFELCVRKVAAQQDPPLDLSSWSQAIDGAEPVRRATLERFAERFSACGFRRAALCPGYGLAEGTLRVSLQSRWREPSYLTIDAARLREHRVEEAADDGEVQVLVGCGRPDEDTDVVIVDPATGHGSGEAAVGEIWVSGPSVAQGYWGREKESEATFRASRVDTEDGPFLRTGDLGCMRDGELYITGRLKELVILRGENHYPQDLESTVDRSHGALRAESAVAFALDRAGEERLVIVAELERNQRQVDPQQIIGAIRQAVAEEHGVRPWGVTLVPPASLPKTSSGKLQRQSVKVSFQAGTLRAIAEDLEPEIAAAPSVEPTSVGEEGTERGVEEIRDWLVAAIARRLGMAADRIDPRQPPARYGLDSVTLQGLTGDLSSWLGRRVSATLFYDHPSLAALAVYLGSGSTPARRACSAPAAEVEPIAVIGLGCRFPGADGPQAFWQLLVQGRDAIREVPPERWDIDAFFDPDPSVPGKMITRWGGFLDRVDRFDADFFGISPREAAAMDPQQRLMLEVAWEAFEDAGLAAGLDGSDTGVVVGISSDDYGRMQLAALEHITAYAGTGSSVSIAANRISYAFGLQGPSLSVDTACSASLVAVHEACQMLRRAEAKHVLAGGVNLILSPAATINFSKAGVMARDGRCKVFDAKADGYVRAEGAGAVVLKPLSQAEADGDPVYAVICASAINQNGRSNGLMAPNGQAQEALLRRVYYSAGVVPGAVQYVEAHGTGTYLGDLIEAQSLGRVLGEGRAAGERCAIGSVKSNIGHLEAAAGIAGLIKVVLMIHRGRVPPSLHFETPHPEIPFDELPIAVQRQLGPWPEVSGPRLAGVSSFGFGGTNAHVLLREAPAPQQERPPGDGVFLLPLSAASELALRGLAQRYRDLLRSGDAPPLADLCYTAGVRRTHHEHRLSLLGATHADLAESLDAFLAWGK